MSEAAEFMLQESLKMQAAGRSRPAAKEASDAESMPDQAAGPGLQNDPGEYNCFLNVIVQCLWHCAAFRDAFLDLSRKVLEVRPCSVKKSTPFQSSHHMLLATGRSARCARCEVTAHGS